VASESTAWIATHMSEEHAGVWRSVPTKFMSQPLLPTATRSPSIHSMKACSGRSGAQMLAGRELEPAEENGGVARG
jgi:hypothetical protein